MKRRTALHVLGVTLAAPVLLPIMQASASATVTDGASLIAAMAAATPGDTITLRGGTYQACTTYWASPLRQACFRISKPLTLEAYPGETPILTYDPANPPIQDTSDYGPIVLIAASATLRNLTIVGTRALGDCAQDTDVNVQVQNGTTVTLDGCTLTSFGHCGVKALTGAVKATNCVMADGGFTGRDHGIYVSQVAYAGRSIIQTCELARCAGYGVHIYGTPRDVNLIGCNVHHNGGVYTPANGGGVLIGGPGCLVQECQITDNTGYGGLVLWKATSAGGAYLHNTILRNAGTGNIVLDQSAAPNVVSANTRHATLWTNTDLSAWRDDGTDIIV